MNIKGFSEWGISSVSRLIISGPCSAETEEQVMQTAAELKECGIHAFRAGIWKPRTRPGSFEGVGGKGLKWLQKIKKTTGLPVMVEVADPHHVDACLAHGIDIFWIGARTTVNPFSVQNLADALKGVDIPVMIKNPINPELGLWLGAIERLNRAGIVKLAAIHRGFSSYEKSRYRNHPNWSIPIELRKRCPGLPMICDPSHICGNRELLYSVAQQAENLNFDGLMIESHINPELALSDASQQITPAQLKKLLKKIVPGSTLLHETPAAGDENGIKRQIDELDRQILGLIAKRMKIASAINGHHAGIYHHAAVEMDESEQWKVIVQSTMKNSQKNQISEEFILRY